MSLAIAQQRELARWYDLIKHPVQDQLSTDDVRIKVVPAGRRSGKTEKAKRYMAREALRNPGESYFLAAPTHAQVKKIFWNDMKLLTFSSTHQKKPSETELILYLQNGSTIQLIGLDKPERIEGAFWSGGIIDEIADIKTGAWENNISPALDTFNPSRPDYRAWCWLIGVPDGLNHYYDLYQYALNSGDPEWKGYTWFSSDILPEKTIAAAKRRMSARQFRQEYEASFETATGRIYDDYNKENHTQEIILPHERLMWCHDQNYTPLSSAVCVNRDNMLYVLDEIVLTSAISKQSAVEFVEKFKDHENKEVWIYGDPAGRAGEKHGHASDYTDIEDTLREHGWKFQRRVKNKAPSIKDRQNSTRAKICTADGKRSMFVNPSKAHYVDKGFSTVQLQKGSTFQEDQKNEFQHITTAVGYLVDYEWPIEESLKNIDIGFVN